MQRDEREEEREKGIGNVTFGVDQPLKNFGIKDPPPLETSGWSLWSLLLFPSFSGKRRHAAERCKSGNWSHTQQIRSSCSGCVREQVWLEEGRFIKPQERTIWEVLVLSAARWTAVDLFVTARHDSRRAINKQLKVKSVFSCTRPINTRIISRLRYVGQQTQRLMKAMRH